MITHFKLKLDKNFQDLMLDGQKCKVCAQVFKAKPQLLLHIGTKHGKINNILKEMGYMELPCMVAPNTAGSAEIQANLLSIKKEMFDLDEETSESTFSAHQMVKLQVGSEPEQVKYIGV
jgi:hypothetical protein